MVRLIRLFLAGTQREPAAPLARVDGIRRCLSATRRHRAVRHSASSIRISRARKRVIGGIAGSTKVNRIGRRFAYAMLVIVARAIVWQVLGSLQGPPGEPVELPFFPDFVKRITTSRSGPLENAGYGGPRHDKSCEACPPVAHYRRDGPCDWSGHRGRSRPVVVIV